MMSGKATYLNRETGESYQLGFEMSASESELGKAWDLVGMVSKLKGWNKVDIFVKIGG